MKYYSYLAPTPSNLQITTMALNQTILQHTMECASNRVSISNDMNGKQKLGCVIYGKRRKRVL